MPVKDRQALTDRGNMTLSAEPRAVNPARLKYDYSQIDAAHRERVQFATVAVQDYMSRAAESMIAAGGELIEVREVLPHGQFLDWAELEFGISERMAQHLMNAAREYGANPKRVTGFSPSVVYVLAAPSTPDEARQEVETKAKVTGTPPTRKEVKRIIEKHKPPKPEPGRVVYTDPQAPVTKPEPPAPVPEPTDLPDGYRLVKRPGLGWQWQRALSERTTLAGSRFETAEEAAAEAHQDWEARQARTLARTVYVEPQTQPEEDAPSPPAHYIVTLADEHYHAAHAALGLMGRYGDRGIWDAIKQAFEEAQRVEG